MRTILRDVVTWNSLITGYVQNGESSIAMDLFSRMDCRPSSATYVAVLKACGSLASVKNSPETTHFCLENGIAIHKQVAKSGFESNDVVATTLLGMYSKCGSMQLAREVFDKMILKNVVAWTSMILGYVQNGNGLAAVDLFASMDCKPDSFAFAAAIKACCSLADSEKKEFCLEKGIAIHEQVRESGFESDVFVASALVDLYSKCGSMDLAREVFNRMVSKACGNLAALPLGLQIHGCVCKIGAEPDRVLATTLMDFYGKCGGSMSRAQELFDNMACPRVVSWNALIAGYCSIGDSFRVCNLVKKMQEGGLRMDAVTFTCVLTACSQAGLVDEGKLVFDSMSRYGVAVSLEHYTSIVDMLGRANRLQEALDLVHGLPFEADPVMWTTLLAASSKWKNLELGKVAFDALVASGAAEATAYVLMSSIYRSFEHLHSMHCPDELNKLTTEAAS